MAGEDRSGEVGGDRRVAGVVGVEVVRGAGTGREVQRYRDDHTGGLGLVHDPVAESVVGEARCVSSTQLCSIELAPTPWESDSKVTQAPFTGDESSCGYPLTVVSVA